MGMMNGQTGTHINDDYDGVKTDSGGVFQRLFSTYETFDLEWQDVRKYDKYVVVELPSTTWPIAYGHDEIIRY